MILEVFYEHVKAIQPSIGLVIRKTDALRDKLQSLRELSVQEQFAHSLDTVEAAEDLALQVKGLHTFLDEHYIDEELRKPRCKGSKVEQGFTKDNHYCLRLPLIPPKAEAANLAYLGYNL